MKKLFFTVFIIFAFALGAYAQPTNPTQWLAIDLYSDLDAVQFFETWDGAAAFPESESLKNVFSDHIVVFSLTGRIPGSHSYSVRAYSEERVVTNPDGSITVYPAGYSGFSNTLDIVKPQVLGMTVIDGFLVTIPQSGIVSTNVHINDTTYAGLTELSPGGEWLRIYNISAFSPGTYNLWSNATVEANGSRWEGDYQVNPLVVTIMSAPQAPAIRGVVR